MSDTAYAGRTAWARSLRTPLRDFLRTETGSACVLLAATVAALVWANADTASYERVWATRLELRLGGHPLGLDPRHLGKSGPMALLFLVVRLEARREVDLGEQSLVIIPGTVHAFGNRPHLHRRRLNQVDGHRG